MSILKFFVNFNCKNTFLFCRKNIDSKSGLISSASSLTSYSVNLYVYCLKNKHHDPCNNIINTGSQKSLQNEEKRINTYMTEVSW